MAQRRKAEATIEANALGAEIAGSRSPSLHPPVWRAWQGIF